MTRLLFISILSLLLVNCSKDDKPVLDVLPDSGNEETSKPAPGIVFDYSRIGEHPRLLLRMEDFARMQSAVDSDSRLAAVHQHILDRAEYLLSQGPLQY